MDNDGGGCCAASIEFVAKGEITLTSHLFSGQKSSPYLTQYLLRHLLNGGQVGDLRLNPAQLDRQAIEDHIYGNHDKPSVVYPQTQERIKHYLDEAKELTDVIDFHQPESQSQIE